MKLKIVLSFILSTWLLGQAVGQEKNLVKAFTKSYEFEYLKKYDEAIAPLMENYSETSYETNLRIGWLYYLAAKHKESVKYYQKAINLMPSAVEPLWGIINPLAVMEAWTEVEKNYTAILKLNPRDSKANYQMGLIYYFRKDYPKAKKYFDISYSQYPFDYYNMLLSAWTSYFLGNKAEAKSLFNKILLYSPTDKSAMEGLALVN